MKALLAVTVFLAIVSSGCAEPIASDLEAPSQVAAEPVRLVDLQAADGGSVLVSGNEDETGKWDDVVSREAPPRSSDPADYGARPDGAYWEDGVVQAKTYELAAGAVITTHTHGLVIYASESITIDGRIDARNLGALTNEPGYPTTRAATMNLYRAYGETDQATGEPLLWGHGGTDDCPGNGGGYIVLNAPQIILNGELDAGSDCGQPGIVYLEGNVSGSGLVTASLIIQRGATQ